MGEGWQVKVPTLQTRPHRCHGTGSSVADWTVPYSAPRPLRLVLLIPEGCNTNDISRKERVRNWIGVQYEGQSYKGARGRTVFDGCPNSLFLILRYGAKSIRTWSVRTHCIQPTTIHTEIFKRSDWLMSTDPVPILLAPYCRILPHFSHDALRPQIQTPLEFMFL